MINRAGDNNNESQLDPAEHMKLSEQAGSNSLQDLYLGTVQL